MKSILITGGTGNIGSEFAQALVKNGYMVFCLVRPKYNMSVAERIKKDRKINFSNIKIIPGDIIKTNAGINASDMEILNQKIDIVLHTAASVKFDKESEQETKCINIEGTKNIISVANRINAKEFHHISSAYVAGDSIFFREEDLSIGQNFRNPYEESKKEAEELVKNTLKIPYTIYRPSIIVGSSIDGHINSFDGFYTLLKYLWRLKQNIKNAGFLKKIILKRICKIDKNGNLLFSINIKCPNDSTLNLIPINWLTDTFLKLIEIPAHCQTYHLVDENPKTVKWLFQKSFGQMGIKNTTLNESQKTTKLPKRFGPINKILDMLSPYILHEAKFENINLKNDLGKKYESAPIISEDYLKKIIDFAVNNGFSKKILKIFRMPKIFKTKNYFIDFDLEVLKSANTKEGELSNFFPNYILRPKVFRYGLLKRFFFILIKNLLGSITWLLLRPRLSKPGKLDLAEINKIYTKEAKSYNLKHHITTRGMDLSWRRSIGWFLANALSEKIKDIKVLDLCTGTGLTSKEIALIFQEYNIDAHILGLDYNKEMLDIACAFNKQINTNIKIEFVKGDATQLSKINKKESGDLEFFELNSFDAVTQMFGIGGIDKPLQSLAEILKILKEDGYFFMVDMHRPIPEFPGEFPIFFIKWVRMPLLESILFEETTIPLVLNRLWGWRDTTLLFYFINLITYRDNDNNIWGFKKVYFDYDPQRWWFSLPFMPIAKIIVKKTKLSEEDFRRRCAILESVKIKIDN